jgi:DNA-binding MarR family transcriptional regulator
MAVSCYHLDDQDILMIKRVKPVTPMTDLLQAVRQMYAAIERFDARAASELGVDRTALRAINAMERGSVTPGSLGAELGLSSGSVTALLDRLERAGHVERRLSRDDGRRRDAELTRTARMKADRIYEGLGQSIEAAFAQTEAERLQALSEGLSALTAAFNAAADKASGKAD